jgi:hypothetical protein
MAMLTISGTERSGNEHAENLFTGKKGGI